MRRTGGLRAARVDTEEPGGVKTGGPRRAADGASSGYLPGLIHHEVFSVEVSRD